VAFKFSNSVRAVLMRLTPGALWRVAMSCAPRILSTLPIEDTTDKRCEIHVLTSKEDWLNLVCTLKSLLFRKRPDRPTQGSGCEARGGTAPAIRVACYSATFDGDLLFFAERRAYFATGRGSLPSGVTPSMATSLVLIPWSPTRFVRVSEFNCYRT
jgi:hypothetical protein